MLNQDCNWNCNPQTCEFAQDKDHQNRYVCLKCGAERDIDRNRSHSSFSSFLLLLLAFLISLQLLANEENQKKQKRSQHLDNSSSQINEVGSRNI
jgi:hypothetical protein